MNKKERKKLLHTQQKGAILYFIYVLIKPWDGEICYVGKGSYTRDQEHARLNIKHGNHRLARVYAKAQLLGMHVTSRKILYGFDEDEMFAIEKELIETLVGNGVDLCNIAEGGRMPIHYISPRKGRRNADSDEIEDGIQLSDYIRPSNEDC